VNDLSAAKTLFTHCPVPIVVSGYEVGKRILYPGASVERDFGYAAHHPVRDAYRLYSRMPYDRPTWDLTSVLYAVRPEHSFHISEPGTMEIADNARILFTPRERGLHRYLRATEQDCVDALKVMTELVTQPPGVSKAE